MASRELHCVVVTPERALLDEKADFIALPMFDGELGVLPGRAPLVGRLGTGELRIKQGATTAHFYVDSGFVQVRDNVVTVLTSVAKKATEIYAPAMENQLKDLMEQLKRTAGADAQAEVQKSIDRTRAQLRVGRHDD